MAFEKWPLRGLGLKVLDLPRQVAYHRRLGLRLLESGASHAVLGFEEEPVLNLRRLENGRPRPERSAGQPARPPAHHQRRCRPLGRVLSGARDDLAAGFGPFRVVSWEHYHHHLGINLLSGRDAEWVTDDIAGLEYYEIVRPGLEPGTLLDPDGIRLELR